MYRFESDLAYKKKNHFITNLKLRRMARLKLSRWKLLVALVLTRRVAAKYKLEIKLLGLLFTTFVGSKFFNTEWAEYTVCGIALFRKYIRGGLLGLLSND